MLTKSTLRNTLIDLQKLYRQNPFNSAIKSYIKHLQNVPDEESLNYRTPDNEEHPQGHIPKDEHCFQNRILQDDRFFQLVTLLFSAHKVHSGLLNLTLSSMESKFFSEAQIFQIVKILFRRDWNTKEKIKVLQMVFHIIRYDVEHSDSYLFLLKMLLDCARDSSPIGKISVTLTEKLIRKAISSNGKQLSNENGFKDALVDAGNTVNIDGEVNAGINITDRMESSEWKNADPVRIADILSMINHCIVEERNYDTIVFLELFTSLPCLIDEFFHENLSKISGTIIPNSTPTAKNSLYFILVKLNFSTFPEEVNRIADLLSAHYDADSIYYLEAVKKMILFGISRQNDSLVALFETVVETAVENLSKDQFGKNINFLESIIFVYKDEKYDVYVEDILDRLRDIEVDRASFGSWHASECDLQEYDHLGNEQMLSVRSNVNLSPALHKDTSLPMINDIDNGSPAINDNESLTESPVHSNPLSVASSIDRIINKIIIKCLEKQNLGQLQRTINVWFTKSSLCTIISNRQHAKECWEPVCEKLGKERIEFTKFLFGHLSVFSPSELLYLATYVSSKDLGKLYSETSAVYLKNANAHILVCILERVWDFDQYFQILVDYYTNVSEKFYHNENFYLNTNRRQFPLNSEIEPKTVSEIEPKAESDAVENNAIPGIEKCGAAAGIEKCGAITDANNSSVTSNIACKDVGTDTGYSVEMIIKPLMTMKDRINKGRAASIADLLINIVRIIDCHTPWEEIIDLLELLIREEYDGISILTMVVDNYVEFMENKKMLRILGIIEEMANKNDDVVNLTVVHAFYEICDHIIAQRMLINAQGMLASAEKNAIWKDVVCIGERMLQLEKIRDTIFQILVFFLMEIHHFLLPDDISFSEGVLVEKMIYLNISENTLDEMNRYTKACTLEYFQARYTEYLRGCILMDTHLSSLGLRNLQTLVEHLNKLNDEDAAKNAIIARPSFDINEETGRAEGIDCDSIKNPGLINTDDIQHPTSIINRDTGSSVSNGRQDCKRTSSFTVGGGRMKSSACPAESTSLSIHNQNLTQFLASLLDEIPSENESLIINVLKIIEMHQETGLSLPLFLGVIKKFAYKDSALIQPALKTLRAALGPLRRPNKMRDLLIISYAKWLSETDVDSILLEEISILLSNASDFQSFPYVFSRIKAIIREDNISPVFEFVLTGCSGIDRREDVLLLHKFLYSIFSDYRFVLKLKKNERKIISILDFYYTLLRRVFSADNISLGTDADSSAKSDADSNAKSDENTNAISINVRNLSVALKRPSPSMGASAHRNADTDLKEMAQLEGENNPYGIVLLTAKQPSGSLVIKSYSILFSDYPNIKEMVIDTVREVFRAFTNEYMCYGEGMADNKLTEVVFCLKRLSLLRDKEAISRMKLEIVDMLICRDKEVLESIRDCLKIFFELES